jgi:A/G-specific adenine glycosylase
MKDSILDKKVRFFRQALMQWHREVNRREMPWKGEKDPYRIWLSEIILQQTRVEQGRAYYERFVQKFPTITALASASDQTVLKCWEGLGYYARCRNLLHTARYVAFECAGVFPDRYEDILALKGVGPYTAAAIASFAFNHPYAVVDGNVFRVLSRYHGIREPIDRPEGKKVFQALAQTSLDLNNPGAYNQALMDFGATVCKPQSPDCQSCPMKKSCEARLSGQVEILPVKAPPKPKRTRWFYFLVPEWQGKVPFRQRSAGDVWEGLWELPLLESDRPLRFDSLQKQMREFFPASWPVGKKNYRINTIEQVLSHQVIKGTFLHSSLAEKPHWPTKYNWVGVRQRNRLPFPKMIQEYWDRSDSGDN